MSIDRHDPPIVGRTVAVFRPNRHDIVVIRGDGESLAIPAADAAELGRSLLDALETPRLAAELSAHPETAWSAR
jgi:hypothetical protein